MTIRLGDRDLLLLRELHSRRFLNTDQIAGLYFPESTSARRRLQQLWKAGLVRRHSEGRGSYVYALTSKGGRAIDLSGWVAPRPVHLAHALAVNDVYLRLREVIGGDSFDFHNEADYGELRPDALIRRHLPGHASHIICLELDRATYSAEKFAEKLRRYNELVERRGLRPDLLLVITPRPKRLAACATETGCLFPVRTVCPDVFLAMESDLLDPDRFGQLYNTVKQTVRSLRNGRCLSRRSPRYLLVRPRASCMTFEACTRGPGSARGFTAHGLRAVIKGAIARARFPFW